MLHKLHPFAFACGSPFHRSKIGGHLPGILWKDRESVHTYASLPFWCMKFHHWHFIPVFYLIPTSGQLLGSANIPGRADTELNKSGLNRMASSETEARQWKKTGSLGEEGACLWKLVEWEVDWHEGREGGGHRTSKRIGGKVPAKSSFIHLPCNTKLSFYPVAFQIL